MPLRMPLIFLRNEDSATLNSETTWDTIEWLSSARKNLDWINERSTSERVMLFLRHSHREVISDHSVQLSTELTELGKRMSFELGRKLPVERPVRVFYSFVPRCYQTADELSNGLKEIGGKVIEMEPLEVLVAPLISDEKVWDHLQPDGKNIAEYVNNWADGNFGSMIEDFSEYKTRLIDSTLGRLTSEKQAAFHIHVTHDLAVMALKRIILERSLESTDRESFLGGFAISIDEDGFQHQNL
jgi:broad specificity phosphatase PhoE